LLRAVLGVGHIYAYPRRRLHYDDETIFAVRKMKDLVEVVVPFMDEHLPPSYKRQQYLTWRDELLDYWEHRARRVKPCIVDGCDEPRRAKCLCRLHYDERYGQ
jgi:hypothetical protein